MTNINTHLSIENSSERVRQHAKLILNEGKGGIKSMRPFVGPALIASIAYIDPGNFATNIQAGASFGYKLLWVVVFASLAAMLFQALSAKIGIVTGKNLCELSRDHVPKPMNYLLWMLSEIAAMATDLAEFLGATIALNLLFGIPMLWGTLLTGLITYVFLAIQDRGFRPIEIAIGLFIALTGMCFVVELMIVKPDWVSVAKHIVTPFVGGKDSMVLIVGIIGATIMPHAIFLHSSLTQDRVKTDTHVERRRLIKWSNREVIVTLSFAGLINLSMVIMAASAFHNGVNNDVASIETAYLTLTPLLGALAGTIFLVALLASGLASSVVGTMAGQVVMQGFVRFSIPLVVRRTITMIPAIIVVWLGFDTTKVLVMSQVVLSLVLPVPLILLLMFSANRKIMGGFTISKPVLGLAGALTLIILVFNVVLIAQQIG
jgi:manganese transport protein